MAYLSVADAGFVHFLPPATTEALEVTGGLAALLVDEPPTIGAAVFSALLRIAFSVATTALPVFGFGSARVDAFAYFVGFTSA